MIQNSLVQMPKSSKFLLESSGMHNSQSRDTFASACLAFRLARLHPEIAFSQRTIMSKMTSRGGLGFSV